MSNYTYNDIVNIYNSLPKQPCKRDKTCIFSLTWLKLNWDFNKDELYLQKDTVVTNVSKQLGLQ